MIRPWHILVFGLTLAAFFALRAPVSLLAREVPGVFAFQRADGTIWDATFRGARIGPYDAGDLRTRVIAADLFRGRLHVKADGNGSGMTGQGSYQAGLGGEKRLLAPDLTLNGLPLRPDLSLAGTTRLSNIDILFSGGKCAAAAGTAQSDILTRNGQLVRWNGPALVGGVQCVGDDAAIDMAGADENGRYALRVLLSDDGAGRWRLETVSGKTEATLALAALGFRPDPSGAMALSGDFRWLPF